MYRLLKRSISIIIIFLILIGSSIPLSIGAEESRLNEYEVKVAFFYNFIKFVEWPDELSKGRNTPLNLYVLGKDPFGEALNSLQGKQVRGRIIETKRVLSPKELKNCHILYISPSEKVRLKDILRSIKVPGVLTIGDTEGFAQKGIIINLYMEEQKVRFEINVDAAKRANLTISSRLLSLSRIVRDLQNRGDN